MHYVHGHVLFSQECMPFIKEWYDLCVQYHEMAGNSDETILNVLLWKYDVADYAPVYDPWYEHYHAYLLGKSTRYGYKKIDSPIYYYMFHGCKNIEESRRILQSLIFLNKTP